MTLLPPDLVVFDALARGGLTSALVALIFTALICVKSLSDFTRTGPQMTDVVLAHYRLYLAYALGRLVLFAFLIALFMAFVGVTAYVVVLVLAGAGYHPAAAAAAGGAAIVLLTGRRFARTLLLSPGVIAASSLYSSTRFFPLWDRLTPERLRAFDIGLFEIGRAHV